MSDFDTTARPYARALFELASAESKLQEWHARLQLASVIASDPEMLAMLDLPSMLANEQSALFLSVASGVKNAPEASADFNNLIALLAENGRLQALPAISLAFETLKQQAEGTVEVQVRSALKLTAKQRDAISKSMVKKLGKEVSITAEVDDSLIAGAIIQAGDMVIDGSAKGRLDKLKTVLNK